MTENEKIELFDKWYDENYDEWAEGEEGIALREELEQAFKAGIAELEAENERLTVSYETLKLHDEEEIEMLKSENTELKADNDARKFAMAMSEKVEKKLREENANVKAENEANENGAKKYAEFYFKTNDQLTKAKEHIENLLYYVKQCNCERSNYAEIEKDIKEAEQFISEVKK